jgi:hypothetical protein
MSYASTFAYRSNFPDISDTQIELAYTIVSAQWSGIKTMWNGADNADVKRMICYDLLVAWWLSNKNPGKVEGAIANGAMPLSGKSISGVSLSYLGFENVQDALKPLLSNQFGIDALTMILACPERFNIYG